jgi:hypothetical protein
MILPEGAGGRKFGLGTLSALNQTDIPQMTARTGVTFRIFIFAVFWPSCKASAEARTVSLSDLGKKAPERTDNFNTERRARSDLASLAGASHAQLNGKRWRPAPFPRPQREMNVQVEDHG